MLGPAEREGVFSKSTRAVPALAGGGPAAAVTTKPAAITPANFTFMSSSFLRFTKNISSNKRRYKTDTAAKISQTVHSAVILLEGKLRLRYLGKSNSPPRSARKSCEFA